MWFVIVRLHSIQDKKRVKPRALFDQLWLTIRFCSKQLSNVDRLKIEPNLRSKWSVFLQLKLYWWDKTMYKLNFLFIYLVLSVLLYFYTINYSIILYNNSTENLSSSKPFYTFYGSKNLNWKIPITQFKQRMRK